MIDNHDTSLPEIITKRIVGECSSSVTDSRGGGGGLEWALDPPPQKNYKNRYAIRGGIYATFSHFLQVEAFCYAFVIEGLFPPLEAFATFFFYIIIGVFMLCFSPYAGPFSPCVDIFAAFFSCGGP